MRYFMSNLQKRVLTAVLTVVLTGACIIGGLFASGNIGKLAAKIEGTSDFSEPPTEITDVAESFDGALVMPEVIRGTKLFINGDISASDDLSSIAKQIKDLGFNTVFLMNSRENRSFDLSDSKSMPLLMKVSDTLRTHGIFTAVTVDSASPSLASDIALFCRNNPCDSIILSDVFNSFSSNIKTSLTQIRASVENSSVNTIICDVPFTSIKTSDAKAFYTTLSECMKEGMCSGVYTEPNTEHDSSAVSFSDTVSVWKDFCDKNGTVIIGQSEDFVTDKKGFEKLEELFSQLSVIYKTDADYSLSTVFCSFGNFSNDEECCRIVRGCVADNVIPENYLKNFKIINQKNTSITTSESKITFTGECNPLYPLSCNSKEIKITEDGDFSVEFDLKVGSNKFVFSHRGKEYTYSVTYKLDLIKSISPSGKLSTPGGNSLEILVVAHRDASVYATLNGAKINLVSANSLITSNENDVGIDSGSDFVTFTGKYNLPESTSSTINLGNVKAFASYKGISDSITGAKITVTSAETVAPLPEVEEPSVTTSATTAATTATTATTTTTTAPAEVSDESDSETDAGNTVTETETATTATTATQAETTTKKPTTDLPAMITPYKYNGVAGKKRMCVVKTYYTETMPISPLNDLSVPLTTPMLQGTFDFIVGESSFDTYTYYNLGSGRRVYRKDVEVIEDAYAMPANSITVLRTSTTSSATETDLYLRWKVPFNVVLSGQKYIKDPHNKREYAVSSLNAKSLDITFYYTSEVSGLPEVANSKVIKSAEWSKSSADQTYTLKLYLRDPSKFYGYSVKYNNDGTLNISIKELGSSSVAGKTIMLDPGHGGADGGATCAANSSSYDEAKINLMIAEKIRDKLVSLGANVIMTRTTDTAVSLDQRESMTRTKNPDIFISIHCDASSSSSSYGTSAYYYKPYSYQLAKAIHSKIVNAHNTALYGTPQSKTDRGTIFYPFSVTRVEECPSVLIEYGFISNITECKHLQDPKKQEALAQATVDGIVQYFAEN